MRPFPAIAAAALFLPLVAAQANRTVDDFSPNVTYTPANAVTHGDLTGFDISKLYNGTISIMNATEFGRVNMTLKFTGSAVWVFIDKPQNDGQYGNGYNIYMDGVLVDEEGSFDQETAAEYGNVAYSNTTMSLGAHTFILEATDGLTYFDYAVFESNSPTPETTIPPVHSSSSTAASGPTATGKTGTTVASGPDASTSASAAVKSKSPIAKIAAAAAVVILLLVGGGVALVLLRRRRRTSGVPSNSPYGGGGTPGGMTGYGTPAAASGLTTQMSQTALLHNHPPSATVSQHSLTLPVSAPPPVPQYHPQNSYSHPANTSYPPPPPQSQYSPPPPEAYPQSQYPPQPQPYNSYPISRAPSTAHSSTSGSSHAPLLVRVKSLTQYDPFASNTLSYIPPASPGHAPPADAIMGMTHVLAEQRMVEAEYARPDPTQWPDEKKRPLDLGGAHVANPNPDGSSPTGPVVESSAVGRSWSTRTGGSVASAGSMYPPSPPVSGHGHGPGYAQIPVPPLPQPQSGPVPSTMDIAAEMLALRAQVARLEGQQQRMELPPPAYD